MAKVLHFKRSWKLLRLRSTHIRFSLSLALGFMSPIKRFWAELKDLQRDCVSAQQHTEMKCVVLSDVTTAWSQNFAKTFATHTLHKSQTRSRGTSWAALMGEKSKKGKQRSWWLLLFLIRSQLGLRYESRRQVHSLWPHLLQCQTVFTVTSRAFLHILKKDLVVLAQSLHCN